MASHRIFSRYLSRYPVGRNQEAYETHFCNGMLKKFGKGSVWDANGCSNLEQLKKLVASNLLHMIERQVMVDKFQSGLSSVFICTFGAGGVGLTLTAASTIILLDRPWTPGQVKNLLQMEYGSCCLDISFSMNRLNYPCCCFLQERRDKRRIEFDELAK